MNTKELDEFYDEPFELIQRYSKCVVKDSSFDSEEVWKIISPNLMFICDEAEKQIARQDIYENFIKSFEERPEIYNDNQLNDVLDKLELHAESVYKHLILGENNCTYKEIKNIMLPLASQRLNESDVAAVSENMNFIDPLTKLRLTNPVRNMKCGHVYEKETILKLLSERIVKCPIPGCVVTPEVQARDLVSDAALRRYLRQNP